MKTLRPGDFVETEVVTNREFNFTDSGSYVVVLDGQQFTPSFYTESAPTTTNGIYKEPFFHSIKSQFYNQEYKTETTQSLGDSLTLIQVSQSAFDEKIKEGSVRLEVKPIIWDIYDEEWEDIDVDWDSDVDSFISNILILDDSFGNLKISGSDYLIGNVFYEFGSLVINNLGGLENEILQSEDFSTTWVSSGLTVTTDTVQSPNSNFMADTITGNGSSIEPYIQQNVTVSSAGNYVFSIYVKSGSHDSIQIDFLNFNNSDGNSAGFDLTEGISTDDSTIELVSNDWYRCSLPYVIDESDLSGQIRIYLSKEYNDLSWDSVGDNNGKFVYFWGAQLHQGSVPLPYVRTYNEIADGTGDFSWSDLIFKRNFDLTFRSTHRKRTLHFQAPVEPSEFNYSTNPTMRIRGETQFDRPRYTYTLSEVSDLYAQTINDDTIIPEFFGFDPSGSEETALTPYVTTVGWYDEVGNLLAAAKLATPTPIPRDFPITFKARIDI